MENIYKVNKNKIKTILSKNLKKDASGRVVISKDDEWLKETEWDSLYNEIKGEGKN